MARFVVLSIARAGSTYFATLLRSNFEVAVTTELLNDEIEEACANPIAYIEKHIVQKEVIKRYVGIKVFPEQLVNRNLTFDQLVRGLRAKFVIVLWRKNAVETLVSRLIAEKTKCWYSSSPASKVETVEVPVKRLERYLSNSLEQWRRIGSQWPIDIEPIFVEYNDLVSDPIAVLKYVYEKMSIESGDLEPRIFSFRQNPATLSEKITNWNDLPLSLRDAIIDVPEVLTDAINRSLRVPLKSLHVVPDREPSAPPSGWRYRVSEPYTPEDAKANVLEALDANSISSAGCWPARMSASLKILFGCPVAQPCCNGFSAVFLALQACDLGPGDEVVLPSMTMIAVSNAVNIIGATPVFVDSATENYNPCFDQFARAISPKTKALIVTHTYGVPTPDLNRLVELCREKLIFLIEDISECLGVLTSGPHGPDQLLGTFGDLACASMYANKLVQAGDGGFVIAKDPKLHSRLLSLVNHGFTPSYHFLHFERAINAKINGLGAALACGTLDHVQEVLNRRREIAAFYRSALKGVPLKFADSYGTKDTPWVFGVECQSKVHRRELREFMAKHGIETRNFFFPLHLQPVNSLHLLADKVTENGQSNFQSRLENNSAFPNAEHFSTHCFYLPTHQLMNDVDLQFICDVIQAYYQGKRELIGTAPKKPTKFFVRIRPGTFEAQTIAYKGSGETRVEVSNQNKYNLLFDTCMNARKLLCAERWDERENTKYHLQHFIEKAKKRKETSIENQLKPYVEYFDSQSNFEPGIIEPWLNEDLRDPMYNEANEIETTTEDNTRQLLCWLVGKMKPRTILEMGSLFGHTSMLMASKAELIFKETKYLPIIYACDYFVWQSWMDALLKKTYFSKGQSFLNLFKKNTAKYADIIKPVRCLLPCVDLPQELLEIKIDLAYIDFTQEASELDDVFQCLKPCLVPNKTVLVFNGISKKSILFFTKNKAELTPIIQCPYSQSKAFLYGTPEEQKIIKKANFYIPPDWRHHHHNAFNTAIEALKDVLHDPKSPVNFVPSVESWLCDIEEFGNKVKIEPWIGIIHQTIDNTEQFYVPDLRRLCKSDRYKHILSACQGLITLTNVQAEYLNLNWPNDLPRVPIQSVLYPLLDAPLMKLKAEHSVLDHWDNGKLINLTMIGTFVRDFEAFYKADTPSNFQKVLLICDEKGRRIASKAPGHIMVMERLKDVDYEVMLRNCVVFLSLLHDGAANTIILECIARNTPIICPANNSCIQYLGETYPLYYKKTQETSKLNLHHLLTKQIVENAINYLKELDKTKFSIQNFTSSIKSGPVALNLPSRLEDSYTIVNPLSSFEPYDVTILICSYKRTHHLQEILETLWLHQDFSGTFEILVWNNNEQRIKEVKRICDEYVKKSTDKKRLDIIGSTKNFYAAVRMAMPALMQSDKLLICDDDVIPNSNFVSFFMEASKVYPNELICLRGHVFLPHIFDPQNPTNVWINYENLKFADDFEPAQLLHFAHSDACLIPKVLLRECASVEMPQSDFSLVDDYWMSFILSHKFNRRLRKLSTTDCEPIPCSRTEDSDTPGLALYTRPEVTDARLRLYMHHMLQGWPKWSPEPNLPTAEQMTEMKTRKATHWEIPFAGFNVSSRMSDRDIDDLAKMNVRHVRIGAVGVDESKQGEFQCLVNDTEIELQRLVDVVGKLEKKLIMVVLTINSKIAADTLWRQIAQALVNFENVIGYDLINEPFTSQDVELHLSEIGGKVDYDGVSELLDKYRGMIKAIREVDQATPIIIEPSFWAHCEALYKGPYESLLMTDANLIISVHFYQPKLLTRRILNKGRYFFPGAVPIFDCGHSLLVDWDKAEIQQTLARAHQWCNLHGIKLFLGEFGISRDIDGASEYLVSILQVCRDLHVPCMLFSYRDPLWEAMDYELGSDVDSNRFKMRCGQSSIMKAILNEMNTVNNS